MTPRVLVADDEPATAELMATVLTLSGYEVVAVTSSYAALAAAKERRPQLVFLDVMMPFKDGRELCRILRGDPDFATIPIVLFSSADEADVDWRGAGATEFLQKPFRIRTLPTLASRLLGTVDLGMAAGGTDAAGTDAAGTDAAETA
jgi:two-component system alkaline phosphatase synthesis response regulator PhoP